LVDEVNVTVENKTQSVSLENSTEVYKNSTTRMLQTSRGHKLPVTNTDDFFMVDGNQILNKLSRDIYLLAVFHQNIL